MGHHLTERGTFKSDKYDWCPEGFFALKFSDEKARPALMIYAISARLSGDYELADDLLAALKEAEDG